MAEIERRHPVGIVLSGGPKSVSEAGAPHCVPGVYDAGVPVLGICYGMQLMTHALGGEVAPAPHREFGLATIHVEPSAPLFASMPVGPAGVGEPRRLRQDGAARLPGHGHERERAGGGDGRRGSPALRAAVPSRGRAHGSRPRHPPQFRVRRLRVHRRLDDVVVRAGGHRAHPRAGRRRTGRLRPQRRRRLDRRRGAHSPRHRRSAHVHLRRQRRDAAGRGGADPEALRAAGPAARLRGRLDDVPRSAGGDHRPGAEAEDHRRRVHRRLRSRGAEARAPSTSSARARCTRT